VITDGRRGDRICAGRDGRGCGAVLEDHIEVQGADRRNHEGEDVSERRTACFPPTSWRLLYCSDPLISMHSGLLFDTSLCCVCLPAGPVND
jgi:hypothetical protein